MPHVDKPPTFPKPSAFTPNPNWRYAWFNAPSKPSYPSVGWSPIQISGHSTDLRLWLEEQDYAYALAVPSIEVVCVQTRDGLLLADVATIQQQALRPHDWQLLSQSLGTKGERLFAWAILPVLHQGRVDDRHFLVLRRCLDDASQVTSYLVFAPLATPLPLIVQAIGARWHIEVRRVGAYGIPVRDRGG